MGTMRRDNEPPRAGPQLRIIRLKANRGGTFGIFGTKIHGFWTHWNGRCSEPCTEPIEDCGGHKREWPLRWKGYLHVYHLEMREEGFLELTPAARNDIILQVGGEEELRGSRVHVERGMGDKSRLKCSILPRWKAVQGTEPPPEKDPSDTLAKLWEFGAKIHSSKKPKGDT